MIPLTFFFLYFAIFSSLRTTADVEKIDSEIYQLTYQRGNFLSNDYIFTNAAIAQCGNKYEILRKENSNGCLELWEVKCSPQK